MDLRDCVTSLIPKWGKIFAQNLGLIIVVILLKFPCARTEFATAFASKSAQDDLKRRTFDALQEMARRISQGRVHARLITEIDTIKGPLLVHGVAAFLMKLHVIERTDDVGGLSLAMGKQRYKLRRYSKHSGNLIDSFLQMHESVLLVITNPCNSVEFLERILFRFLGRSYKIWCPQLVIDKSGNSVQSTMGFP